MLVEARLPALEGEAFLATVAAFAEKLRVEGDGLTKAQRSADAVAAMVAALAADAKTPTHNGQPATATVLIPLSEAERITNGIARQRQCLPDLTDAAVSDLSLATATIGTTHTLGALGDAAARFLLCATELTGAIVTTGCDDHEPSPGQMLTALLGAAPLQPLALGRGQRLASAAQRQALEIRDGGCVIDNCGIAPGHCQTLPHRLSGGYPHRTGLGRRRRHRHRQARPALLATP